ncbi:DUF1254 domain-containing protein [Listeria booriae]|uniref:DUF1254 domain-containing protein n=1 Tax=Listeria booriae TaxID=1552123 RepID=UPI0016269B09|nr:DUF1254 domain-containing protein [Listeria booriae]MBC2325561.1 DUF1254 domain-containing protein [Listeria booriae]
MIQKQLNTTEKLAIDAYIYGFPLLFNLEQMKRYVEEGIGANLAAPFNHFSHAKTLATPEDTFVTINNDTIYSMAQLDLSVGPIVLHVPDVGDRYYVLQFVDAWTNNFAYVGKRGTGTKAGDFYLTPPGWSGTVPENMQQIKVPTRLASIVGRWVCDGEADIPNVSALQELTTLTVIDTDNAPLGFPEVTETVPAEIQFYEKLRVAMHDLVPSQQDITLQNTFLPLGLAEGDKSPLLHVEKAVYDALKNGQVMGLATIKKTLLSGVAESENGWRITFHSFDYNADFFEVGTINSPEWIIADRKVAIVERAIAAMGGLWGNHGYEAAYVATWTDAEEKTLNGANDYTLTLNPVPPVDAFWSITMYDAPDFYLVDNPIQRYSIGDRTPGIQYEEDGSLTVYMSVKEPTDPKKRANWLPTPAGDFRPVMRMYQPDKSVIAREYHFPAIKKV